MQNIKNYIIIAILTLSVIAGIFSNIPLSYAQNDTMSMANMTEEEEEERRGEVIRSRIREEMLASDARKSVDSEEALHNE